MAESSNAVPSPGLHPAYETLDLRAEPELTLTIYAAEPGSSTTLPLALLAS